MDRCECRQSVGRWIAAAESNWFVVVMWAIDWSPGGAVVCCHGNRQPFPRSSGCQLSGESLIEFVWYIRMQSCFHLKYIFQVRVAHVTGQCEVHGIHQMRKQSLTDDCLQVIFNFKIYNWILYALSAWSDYLSCNSINRLDAVFKRLFGGN